MDTSPYRLRWLGIIPLFNLLAAACLGLVLRVAFVRELPGLNYKYILQGHSHVAMVGWLYLLLTLFLYLGAFGKDQDRKFRVLFWLTQGCIVGMLISFPLQGYGSISITFSTTYLLLAYIFTAWAWKKTAGDVFFRAALAWLVLSTLGTWVLAATMVYKGQFLAYYHGAIQFFLHFQFNGWFTFAVLSLFFRTLDEKGTACSFKDKLTFFRLLVLSTGLTFALAITWSAPRDFIFYINSLGAVLQVVALYYFLRITRAVKRSFLSGMKRITRVFYHVALWSFILKVLIQLFVVMPPVAVISYTIRLYVIGFFHLVLLGTITMFLIAYGLQKQYFTSKSWFSKAGWWLLVVGFILMESLLFGQGTMFWAGWGFIPGYYAIIFFVSALLPLGIAFALAGQILELNKMTNLKTKLQ